MLKHKKKPEETSAAAATSPDAAAPAAPGAPAPEVAATAAAPAATPPAPPPAPAEAELAALKDKHLRMMADFENIRKRQAREREDFVRRATEALAMELLPAVDHLELALANAPDKSDPFVKGVQMVADQILAALAKVDLKPFQATGEVFDPTRHEALTQLASAEVPAHRVLQQLRRGYTLGGRLMRPAQVIISSGPPAPPAAPAEDKPMGAASDAGGVGDDE